MYCPRCATQNSDDIKFCRSCGTNLETVAQALSGKKLPAKSGQGKSKTSKPEKSWLDKRREGMDGIVRGTGLLGASLLIGVALGLFSNAADWIIIWVGLAGWMACWGFISIVSGIGALAESRFLRRHLEQATDGASLPPAQTSSPGTGEVLPERSATPLLSPPASVTEQTTQPLSKQQASKQAG
jgi:hypothetical protein